jgi:O-antigen/teichoic acid export membrane protein
LSDRLLNVVLRGLVACSRFALVFFIAKYLGPEDLGVFGLLLASVSFGTLLIGGDFYTYSQRMMLEMEAAEWSFVIQHQVFAIGLCYLLFLPCFLLMFTSSTLDWQYVAVFYGLLLTEHIALEIVRLLTVMQRQLLASWVLLIQRASWILVLIPLMVAFPELRSLDIVIFAWLAGVASAILLGAFLVFCSVPKWRLHSLDTGWILLGFKVCLAFLLATLCLRGLLTFDRYAIEALASPAELGVYTFYIGVVISVVGFLDPAIYAFLYPRMLQSYAKDPTLYRKALWELGWSTLAASVFLLFSTWLIMPTVIHWLGRPIYAQHTLVFEILLIAALFSALAMIPHYALYAMKKDNWIYYPHVIAFVFFLIFIEIVDFKSGLVTVAVGLLLSFLLVFAMKTTGFLFYRTARMANR